MIGATTRKTGAAIRLVSKIITPCMVLPLVSVRIPRMNVTKRTGNAMIHVRNPIPGIKATRQVTPIINQLAKISFLGFAW